MLSRIPLVRDFIRLFSLIRHGYPDTMPRLPFWKTVAGFVLVYAVTAAFVDLFWMGVLLHHVRHNGNLFVDIGIFLELAVSLTGFVVFLPAEAWRLRDAGLSAWWLLLWLVPYLGAAVLAILFLLPSKIPAPKSAPPV
jgi:uncharacterized membrane protein YhaH (DUF805 family)